jgi:hypothetical protein
VRGYASDLAKEAAHSDDSDEDEEDKERKGEAMEGQSPDQELWRALPSESESAEEGEKANETEEQQKEKEGGVVQSVVATIAETGTAPPSSFSGSSNGT